MDSQAVVRKKPVPPTLSAEQRLEAYKKALRLRRRRADLKTFLSEKPYMLEYVWAFKDAQGMKVLDLLTALPGVGIGTARKYLELAGIPEKNTVKACGPRQRERLLALLGERARV